jgi:hypothetical protein
MERHIIASQITLYLFLSCISLIAQVNQQPMSNSDVVKMVHSGMSEAAIIDAIKVAAPNFDTADSSIAALIQQKVPEKVILAILRRQMQWNYAHGKAQKTFHGTSSDIFRQKGKWDVELHVGLSSNHQVGGWEKPPLAEAYSLLGSSAKGYWNKRVSSWYFGSGAQLINLSSSLDSILIEPVVKPQGQRVFGFGASRALSEWMAVEITFDRGSGLAITEGTLAQIKATSDAFKKYWGRLNVPGNTPTSSISTISGDGGRQLFTSGAVVLSWPKATRIRPFATAGIGMLSSGYDTFKIALVGSYGGPYSQETDTVHLTFDQSRNRAFGPMFGGGVKIGLARHWGIRFDVRSFLYRNPISTVLDTNHTNTSDTAWIVNATDANGNLAESFQKITGSGMAVYSTLSGPSISGFKTYFGTGIQRCVPVRLGFFYRF